MPADPSPVPVPSDEAPDAVELAAAEWLVRQEQGLTPEQRRDFQRWLCCDERHARMHAQMQVAWEQLGRVPPGRFPAPVRRRRVSRRILPLAMAAALVLGLTVRWIFPFRTLPEPVIHESAVVGGFKAVTLSDGSVVTLNGGAAVEVRFTPRERQVTLLQGEANFAVAKNPARPFVVRAGPVAARAVGTAFDVRLRAAAVEVLVTEGRVRVAHSLSGQNLLAAPPGARSPKPAGTADSDAEPLLVAGHRAVISLASGRSSRASSTVTSVAEDEIQRELTWKSRTLVFSDERLARIVEEFNRCNRHQLVIADARLADRRFGGKFPAEDYGSLVAFLETNLGVVAERHGDETILKLGP